MANLGILMAIMLVLAGIVTADQASNVYTTYHIYNMAGIGYDLYAASAYCSTTDGNMPLEWRMRYPWTAFCGPVGPRVPQACGSCLRAQLHVRNSRTGAEVIVRIVDECHQGGLDLEEGVFARLDTDGQGNAQGHMSTEYEFVNCMD